MLVYLKLKYPYHSYAYEASLEREFNPFSESLRATLFRGIPSLTPKILRRWHNLDLLSETFEVSCMPTEEELKLLHTLLDADRAARLLEVYISLTITGIIFYSLGLVFLL